MENLSKLKEVIKKYGKACVAYSGGVDSDLVLNVSKEVLGDNVIAIIGKGAMLAGKDFDDAIRLAKRAGVKYYIIEMDVFTVPEFVNNDRKRCYFCKKNVMGGIIEKAKELGFDYVFDGKNADDGKVYRPGGAAAEEMGIISPLYLANISKPEIRQIAKSMNLDTWDKASNSCLATRFPYDTKLTPDMFEKVEKAEKIIADLGIPSGRVRVHGDIARIEMPKNYMADFVSNEEVIKKIKEIGFRYITLDLEGFRSGSMD